MHDTIWGMPGTMTSSTLLRHPPTDTSSIYPFFSDSFRPYARWVGLANTSRRLFVRNHELRTPSRRKLMTDSMAPVAGTQLFTRIMIARGSVIAQLYFICPRHEARER